MKENNPDLWRTLIPVKTSQSHKYKHGHSLIYGANELTGATRLAASACARAGSGLVTVLAKPDVADIYRTSLPAHILVRNDLDWFDKRITTKIYGPGGLPLIPDFNSTLPTILDADALLNLPSKLSKNYILTPHAGEFERAFPNTEGTHLEKAQTIAKKMEAHLILKGAETIIIAPDGNYIVNRHASPWLSTAGTGDVLSGLVAGLTAQNMPIFEACCAAVWIHGECGLQIGQGLVASDIVDMIPSVLKQII